MSHDKRSGGAMEYRSKGVIGKDPHSTTPLLQHSNFLRGFALTEVMIGLTIFLVGVLMIGRSVENCINASTLSAEEERIREILSNRMAEVQTAPGNPDVSKQIKVETGYGTVTLIQKAAPANLTEQDGNRLTGINRVTLTAEWERGGVKQSEALEFYVYRPG